MFVIATVNDPIIGTYTVISTVVKIGFPCKIILGFATISFTAFYSAFFFCNS